MASGRRAVRRSLFRRPGLPAAVQVPAGRAGQVATLANAMSLQLPAHGQPSQIRILPLVHFNPRPAALARCSGSGL